MARRDGIDIPEPDENERSAFDAWLRENDVKDPFHPDQHYDYVGSFRAREGRQKGVQDGHFTDRFKLPGHETFSNESQYARGPMARFAGSWNGDKFSPPKERFMSYDEFEAEASADYSEFEAESETDQGPPLAAASPDVQRRETAKGAIAKLKSGGKLNPAEVAVVKRYLGARTSMTPNLERGARIDEQFAEGLGLNPDRVRQANATALDSITLGAMSGHLGDAINPAGAMQHRQDVATLRDEEPLMSFASSAAGSLPLAGIIPNTLPAALMTGAAGGVLSSRADDFGDLAKDAAIGTAAGGVGYGIGQGIGKGIQYGAGKAMQLTGRGMQQGQRALEAVAEKVASADDIALASPRPSSGSKLQQSLKEVIDGAQLALMGPEAGGASQASERALSGVAAKILDKPMSALSQAERGATMKAVAHGFNRRGLKVSPESVANSFDDLIRAAGKEPNEVTVRDAIRLVNQRDPAFAQRAAVNASKKWGPIRAGMDVDPREGEMVRAASGMLDDIEAGRQNRFNVRGEVGGRAQLAQDTPLPVVPAQEQAAAAARAKARDEAAVTAREAMSKTNPGASRGGFTPNEAGDTAVMTLDQRNAMRQPARTAFQQTPEFKQQARSVIDEVNDQVAARGVNPRASGATAEELGAMAQQATEPWAPFDANKAKALTGTDDPALALSTARDRIRAINAGKGTIQNVENIAGMFSLGTIPAGIKAATSDTTARAGRFLERTGSKLITPQAITRSWIANPAIMEHLAQRPGQIGKAAKFALEGLEHAGEQGLKSRLFVLSLQPWFREYAAQQTSGQ